MDGSGNVIVTGTSAGIGTYGDWATIKYSNAGVALWTNRYEGLHDDAVNGLAVDGSGNVFVTGYRTDGYSLRFDVVTIAYSSGGAILWSQVYYGTGSGDDSGNAIAADGKGDVLVTGYSVGTNGYADIFTIKYGIARPPLNVQRLNDALILSWTNSTFRLQSAPALSGVFTNMASATSPYTHQMSGSQQYFRLYSD